MGGQISFTGKETIMSATMRMDYNNQNRFRIHCILEHPFGLKAM
jgi:hypothetical protein